jgi:succinate dehydrogenase / fumarate reductase cytochrome b subunit
MVVVLPPFPTEENMGSLSYTVRSAVRYRGKWGHWSWVAHRVSGLAVLFYLILHVWDTANATFWPDAYEFMIEVFKWPPFGVGEIFLMAAVLYHAFNGIRITILDFKPELWRYQRESAVAMWAIFFIVFVPIAIYMLTRLVGHCGELSAEGASCWTLPTYPVVR